MSEEHGPVFRLRGNDIALWCRCQFPAQRAVYRPAGVRPKWTVPEALAVLEDWHRARRSVAA